MTDYINDIAVDLDIYSKWPEKIKDLGIVYVPEDSDNPNNLILVRSSDEYPAMEITELLDFPETEFLGRIMWKNFGDLSPVSGLVITEEYQDIGVAKFLCVLARTWVAEKFNSKIYAPEEFRSIEVEEILKQIAVEYNEQSLVVKTIDGEYKVFSEISDPEQELGV